MKKKLLEKFKNNAIPREKQKKITGGDGSSASELGAMAADAANTTSKSNYIPGLSNISSK